MKAGLTDLLSETLEGADILEIGAALAAEQGQKGDEKRLHELAEMMRTGTPAEVNELAHRPEVEALMHAYSDRRDGSES